VNHQIELRKVLTNILHEVNHLVSKTYLQLVIMVLKLGRLVSINTFFQAVITFIAEKCLYTFIVA